MSLTVTTEFHDAVNAALGADVLTSVVEHNQLIVTVPAASSDPLGDAELRASVTTALAALPPEQQAVVVLKIYQQHSFAEIGARLGLSLNTVASRYRYALAKLRHTLEEVRHG